jgi:hypothetical protein
MNNEKILYLCKIEIIRLMKTFQLIDDDIINDYLTISYMNCVKWYEKGNEINNRIIKIFVKRAMFLK